jgi:hypothetical protein
MHPSSSSGAAMCVMSIERHGIVTNSQIFKVKGVEMPFHVTRDL